MCIAVLTALLFCSACSQEVDKKRFQRLNEAAWAVKKSLTQGADYQQFSEMMKRLSAELSDMQGKVRAKKEKELLKAYSDLLVIYQDGNVLWRYKLEFEPFDIVPAGQIYVGQYAEPVVLKYRLPTESHLYEPTQQYWRSISEDSIRIIWSNADAQLQLISDLLSG